MSKILCFWLICSAESGADILKNLMGAQNGEEENTAELTNMIKYIFRTVFVHRYRDIVPDIRSICMYEIGLWMKKCHSIFLDDSYLKYIGWTINDKFADVRLKCLQSLQPLFSTEQFICRLELFAQKFKDRIIQMTLGNVMMMNNECPRSYVFG